MSGLRKLEAPTFGSNFPSIKNGEIPSKHLCEFVRAAEKVGYRRGVPARASRGPDAAFVERPRDRFERGCASSSDGLDDRQKTGCELVGGGVLDLPATPDAPGCDHSARVSQSTNRNQDTGNQGQHYAQDHEVPQRELRAPFRLFGIIAPGLATS